jgi:hypothetical protein
MQGVEVKLHQDKIKNILKNHTPQGKHLFSQKLVFCKQSLNLSGQI